MRQPRLDLGGDLLGKRLDRQPGVEAVPAFGLLLDQLAIALGHAPVIGYLARVQAVPLDLRGAHLGQRGWAW